MSDELHGIDNVYYKNSIVDKREIKKVIFYRCQFKIDSLEELLALNLEEALFINCYGEGSYVIDFLTRLISKNTLVKLSLGEMSITDDNTSFFRAIKESTLKQLVFLPYCKTGRLYGLKSLCLNLLKNLEVLTTLYEQDSVHMFMGYAVENKNLKSFEFAKDVYFNEYDVNFLIMLLPLTNLETFKVGFRDVFKDLDKLFDVFVEMPKLKTIELFFQCNPIEQVQMKLLTDKFLSKDGFYLNVYFGGVNLNILYGGDAKLTVNEQFNYFYEMYQLLYPATSEYTCI
jgi:hypothetical protein